MEKYLSWSEIAAILDEALQLSVYSTPLKNVFKSKFKISDWNNISIRWIHQALDSYAFQDKIPYGTNYIPTSWNIELVKASIQLIKLGLLSRNQIREGIKAYLLSTRELGVKFLPINPEVIVYTLRLIGKMMSVKAIKKWIRQYFR